MGTTQPIRNNDELTAFRMYYKDIRPNSRNYCLIVMGLNTALRISDLLRLKWDNVYNFKHHEFRTHFLINEQKTGKNNYVTLNYNATDALKDYFNERNPNDHEFIFTKNTCRYQPISRTQAYRIVQCRMSTSAVIRLERRLAITPGKMAHLPLCSWMSIITHHMRLPSIIWELSRMRGMRFI